MGVDLGSARRTLSYTGARSDVTQHVESDRTNILDVGCSTGALGAALKVRLPNASVTGVEANGAAASVAARVLDHVHVADVDKWSDLQPYLVQAPFDCVICADVLEHTRDPWTALGDIVQNLAPGGQAIVSLPNVGHWDTLVSVFLRRRFPRRERGLFDETHLRWFARRDVEELVEGAGLEVHRTYRTFRVIEAPHRINRFARFIAIPPFRDLLTFQFIVDARKPLPPRQ